MCYSHFSLHLLIHNKSHAANSKKFIYACRCPEGYRIGRLLPQHSELVKSKWNVSQTPTTWIQKSIENLFSVAIFQEENPLEPVSWVMEYPSRELGYGYTLENHRGKMLYSIANIALCQVLLYDSPTTPLAIWNN